MVTHNVWWPVGRKAHSSVSRQSLGIALFIGHWTAARRALERSMDLLRDCQPEKAITLYVAVNFTSATRSTTWFMHPSLQSMRISPRLIAYLEFFEVTGRSRIVLWSHTRTVPPVPVNSASPQARSASRVLASPTRVDRIVTRDWT